MKSEIIAVGTELLLGQILNTNARFISQELSNLGIDLYFQTVVGDNVSRLKTALDIAFNRVDTVILTGGLGPTKDDLTKETVANYFGLSLKRDEYSINKIKEHFAKINKEMTENNKKQADMPEGCRIIENFCGTAPGCIIEQGGKTAIMLPGPPMEMEPMFVHSVLPYFKSKTDSIIKSISIRLFGIGESAAETEIQDLTKYSNPTVAPYAKEGEVELRITAKATTEKDAMDMIIPVLDEIKKRLSEYIYGYDDDSLEKVTVEYLINNKLTISAAESCTGGLVSGALTSVPGSSEILKYGYVTYANEAKINMLDVKEETLENFGAVSSQTAIEMAIGAMKNSKSDIGVATTGIAGPGGGTNDKPVGLVYIALADKNGAMYKQLNLAGDRDKIRRITTKNILGMILRRK